MKQTNVMEKVYEKRRLLEAWQQVKRNDGVAGIDNMTVKEFEERRRELLPIIRNKLIDGTYKFKPTKRIHILKEGGKVRNISIPTVMDRIVAQSVNTVLTELYETEYSRSSFGFRKGKSQREAIEYSRKIVNSGKRWAVSIDLKSFFDEIPHELIFKLIRRKVSDERFVTLIARGLKSGVRIEGKLEKTSKGIGQGSPSSPTISNIVLTELDREIERRGLQHCRWADDFVIFLSSERAGHRVMKGITGYLEEKLELPVNKEKSIVAKVKEISFLGFRIVRKKIQVAPKALKKCMERIRELTVRNNPVSMRRIIVELNEFLRGWINYFQIQGFKGVLEKLDQLVRNRLRAMQLKKWKKPKKFQRMLIKAGWESEVAKQVWIKMDRWQSVKRMEVTFLLNLKWFRKMGLIFLTPTNPVP